MKKGAGPPEKKAGPKEKSSSPRNRTKPHEKRYCQKVTANEVSYNKIIRSRFLQGLLQPFQCAGCGIVERDALGWNGPKKPLCWSCADGGRGQ
jgi:hypothetical protein